MKEIKASSFNNCNSEFNNNSQLSHLIKQLKDKKTKYRIQITIPNQESEQQLIVL